MPYFWNDIAPISGRGGACAARRQVTAGALDHEATFYAL
jgi:hypothetical protein